MFSAEVLRYSKMNIAKPKPFMDQSEKSLWLLAGDTKLRMVLLRQLEEHCPDERVAAMEHLSERPASVTLDSDFGWSVEGEAMDVWLAVSCQQFEAAVFDHLCLSARIAFVLTHKYSHAELA